MTITHLQIATAVALIVGYFAAHAAGLLTKAHAPQWVLGLVTTVLAALAGVLPTVVWNEHDNWKAYLVNVFAALFAATMAHRSQVPEALQVRTPGLVGARRSDAGYGLVELLVAVLLVIVILWVLLALVGR